MASINIGVEVSTSAPRGGPRPWEHAVEGSDPGTAKPDAASAEPVEKPRHGSARLRETIAERRAKSKPDGDLEGPVLFQDVLDRVDVALVHQELVVQVRPGAAAGAADHPDDVSALDPLPHLHVVAGEVAVARDDPVAMGDKDGVAEPA